MNDRQKKNRAQRITAGLFIILMLTPLHTRLMPLFQVGVRFSHKYYSGVTFNDIVSAWSKGDIRLVTICGKNSQFDHDLRRIASGQRYHFLDYYGFLQRLMGKNYIPDKNPLYDVYRLGNGYVTDIIPEQRNISNLANRLVGLNNFLKDKHVEMLYVQAPFKICKNAPDLPKGAPVDSSNMNADRFLELIERGGVTTLDLRDEIHKTGLDHYSLFFRTDHHWTPEAGFWAFQVLVNALRSRYHFDIDPFFTDIANYTKKTYRNWFLGSWGKRTGRFYTGLDDFTTIQPNFETKFNVHYSDGSVVTGSCMETLLAEDHVKNRLGNAYLYYCPGSGTHIDSRNEKVKNHKKILLIHDSFARVIVPFLAMTCETLITVDIRKSNDFSLVNAITGKRKPDIVIVLYNPDQLEDNITDSFTSSAFDFGIDESLTQNGKHVH